MLPTEHKKSEEKKKEEKKKIMKIMMTIDEHSIIVKEWIETPIEVVFLVLFLFLFLSGLRSKNYSSNDATMLASISSSTCAIAMSRSLKLMSSLFIKSLAVWCLM